MVPEAGIEPARPYERGILSLFLYLYPSFTKTDTSLVLHDLQPYSALTKPHGFLPKVIDR